MAVTIITGCDGSSAVLTHGDPLASTEPSTPTEPSDPTEPSESAEPSDPTEPSEPAEPSDPTEPSEPTEPSAPTEPSELTESTETGEPVATPEPEPTPAAIPSDVNVLSSRAVSSRFFSRSGFGATDDTINNWVGADASAWLTAEFNKAPELMLPAAVVTTDANNENRYTPAFREYGRYHLTRELIESPAELRTRMTYALSQLLVVGGDLMAKEEFNVRRSLRYRDVLNKHAFGNYRDLLHDVTYSPVMAEWLTYMGSKSAAGDAGRQPDENYAREIMQLFSIGLWELNMDGSKVLDADGNPIPTYDSEDVANLARVFTGLSYDYSRIFDPGDFWYVKESGHRDLIAFAEHHDPREKDFLNTYIPPDTDSATSIEMALDGIFAHRNLAPFVARHIIQRFTASNPSPDYIERVATAFESGLYVSANGTEFGTGVRGNLEATLAATLLDHSLFMNAEPAQYRGKAREPILRLLQWFRAFDVENLDYLTEISILNNTWGGQKYFEADSVFNFYRPGYVPPGTESSELNMTVPEMQIVTSTNIRSYMDMATDLVFERLSVDSCPKNTVKEFAWNGPKPCEISDEVGPRLQPDYSNELELADNPVALVDHLNIKLTGEGMSDLTKLDIVEAVSMISINDLDTSADMRRKRVQLAIFMTMTSPAYSVSY